MTTSDSQLNNSSASSCCGGDFDLHDPQFVRDPFPIYDEARARCPVIESSRYGGYFVLTRYDDVKRAARDHTEFTATVPGITAFPALVERTVPKVPIEMDPPEHNRYRQFLSPMYARTEVLQFESEIRDIARSLLEGLRDRATFDLAKDFARPLSGSALSAFTGLPIEDMPRWFAWFDRMAHSRLGGAHRDESARAEFLAYIDTIIERAKESPGENLVGMLLTAEMDGIKWSHEQIASYLTTQIFAGFSTTSSAIIGALWHLGLHPDERAKLRNNPELVPTAVDEFLRYLSPIQNFGRNAARDLVMHGRAIPKSAVVLLSFGSANRDPAAFDEADTCVLDRKPNRHLAFGAGPHTCLGQHLARLEITVALEETLRTLPEYRLDPAGVEYDRYGDVWGIASLPASAQ